MRNEGSKLSSVINSNELKHEAHRSVAWIITAKKYESKRCPADKIKVTETINEAKESLFVVSDFPQIVAQGGQLGFYSFFVVS